MFEFFKRFLDRLAKSNEKEFQGQTPDCCTINQTGQAPQPHNDSEDINRRS